MTRLRRLKDKRVTSNPRWPGLKGNELRKEKANVYVDEHGDVRIDIDSPDKRTILVTRGDLYIYTPKTALVEQYSLRKHKNRLEPFVRLGFSTTGKKLEDDFLVTSLGEDDIGESRAIGLELTPKKEKDRATVAKVRVWIDQASWMPKRQEITDTQAGETLTVTYERMARNLKLNPDLFKNKWPKGTDKVRR
jgi:outer membrane lipoprotein-sorting protein